MLPVIAALAFGLAVSTACRSRSDSVPARSSTAPVRGGHAVVSIRTEPRSFNRMAARDSSTDVVATLTQAKLVRINKVTQDTEPWLAEKWTVDPDGRRYTLTLRQNILFSDGRPFTADDVVFSFQAAYDKDSTLRDSLMVSGAPLAVAAVDPHTVTITFPTPFAPGVRLLDNLPILPKHKLDADLKGGAFVRAWSLSASPSEIVGLGPFVLKEYVPGQRLVFDRNPRYWRKAANGTALPYLDRLTVEIVPDQNAELLRLTSGQLDVTYSEVPAEAYASVKRAADEGRVKMFDLGVGLDPDSFWMNLKPDAFAGDPRAAWLQRDELRRAISLAVDRAKYADTVFFGAGEPVFLPVTRANKKWYPSDIPPIAHDPAAARALLATIGLQDRDGDGLLEDARKTPVRFTLVTQKGRPRLERGAAVIRDDLKALGITMDIVALDGGAVYQTVMSKKYDAVYFHPTATDTDPATTQDFWFSSGASHFWNMAQPKPATEWEKQIDELMARQIASADEAERKQLFVDVLKIFVAHQPVVYFAAPRVYVAVSSRMTSLTPAVTLTPVLWDPESLAVTPDVR
jgi:peptide/nickel transport system substrate-binding protein